MKVKLFDDFIEENKLMNINPEVIKCNKNDRGSYILEIGCEIDYQVHDVGLNGIWRYFRSYLESKNIEDYLKTNLRYNKSNRCWEVRNG